MQGLAPGQALSDAARIDLLAAWSAVHGFAHLALAGKLSHMHEGATSARLLAEILPPLLMRLWPDSPEPGNAAVPAPPGSTQTPRRAKKP
jgi:hypothetical protein